jgi:hypothetical protein
MGPYVVQLKWIKAVRISGQRAEGDPPDPRIHLRRGTSVTPHVRHAPPLTAEQDIEYVVHIRRRGSFPVHRT